MAMVLCFVMGVLAGFAIALIVAVVGTQGERDKAEADINVARMDRHAALTDLAELRQQFFASKGERDAMLQSMHEMQVAHTDMLCAARVHADALQAKLDKVRHALEEE